MDHATPMTGRPEDVAQRGGSHSRRKRVAGLDGVRGAAVLLVVFHHLSFEFFRVPGYVPTPPDWAVAGFLGVDVFFVLSGFLVTSMVIERKSATAPRWWVDFYQRRAVRLLPALVVLLVVHVVHNEIAGFDRRPELWSVALVLLGVANLAPLFDRYEFVSSLIHFWSLAIEWQFYLTFPLLVRVFPPNRRRSAVVVLLFAAVAVAVWRRHLLIAGVAAPWLYVRTDTRADAILIGVALAYAWPWVRRLPKWSLEAAGWSSLVGLAYIVAGPGESSATFLYRGGFTAVAALAAGLVAAVVGGTSLTSVFEFKPLVSMGRYSYAIYIWHVPLFIAVSHWMPDAPALIKLATGLGLTAAATIGSWKLVEQPASEWFQRLRSRHLTAAGVDAQSPEAPQRVSGPV